MEEIKRLEQGIWMGKLKLIFCLKEYLEKESKLGRLGTLHSILEQAIVEVEEIVEPGQIKPDDVHTPGIFVYRVVLAKNLEKRIEILTFKESKNKKKPKRKENGLLGIGDFPKPGEEDADIVNASKATVTTIPGSSLFPTTVSFGTIRGKHLDMTVMGSMEVA